MNARIYIDIEYLCNNVNVNNDKNSETISHLMGICMLCTNTIAKIKAKPNN